SNAPTSPKQSPNVTATRARPTPPSPHVAARSAWPERSSRLRQDLVSGGGQSVVDESVEFAVEGAPGGGEAMSFGEVGWKCRIEVGESWCEDASVCLGEHDRDAPSKRGELVAVAVRQALDDVFAAEPA